MGLRNGLRILRNQRAQPGPAHSAKAPTEPGGNFLGLQNRSKIDPKIDQNFDVILVSFLVPLGALLASLLSPLGRPNRPKFGPRGPKIGPRRPKKASRPAKMIIFMPKCDFSKIIEKPKEIQRFWLLQPAQNRPKMAPSPVKMAQDRTQTAPRRS